MYNSTIPMVPDAHAVAAVREALTPIEHQVVMLALADDRASIRPRSVVGTWIGLLFAVRSSNRLADARLEALRCFCVEHRFGGDAATHIAIRRICTGAGLTDDKLLAAAIATDLAVLRSRRRERR